MSQWVLCLCASLRCGQSGKTPGTIAPSGRKWHNKGHTMRCHPAHNCRLSFFSFFLYFPFSCWPEKLWKKWTNVHIHGHTEVFLPSIPLHGRRSVYWVYMWLLSVDYIASVTTGAWTHVVNKHAVLIWGPLWPKVWLPNRQRVALQSICSIKCRL